MAEPTPVEGQVEGAPAVPDTPYFSYKYPDGKEESYATREELAKGWREHSLRRSDYTKKTQELAAERQKHEQMLKAFEDEKKGFQKSKGRYDEWDEILRARPELRRRLEQLSVTGASPDEVFERSKGYADEKLTALEQKIQQLEEERAAERQERELDKGFDEIEQEFPDMDRTAMREALMNLGSGETLPLLRTLYHAIKGQSGPAEVEKKLAVAREKKAQAAVPSGGGGTVKTKEQTFKSLDEAKLAALRDSGLG